MRITCRAGLKSLSFAAAVIIVAAACSSGSSPTVTSAPATAPTAVPPTSPVQVTQQPSPTTAPPTATPTPQPTATPRPTATPVPKVWRIGILEDVTSTNIWDVLGPSPSIVNLYAVTNRYPYLYTQSLKRNDWVPAWADGYPTAIVQEGDFSVTTVKVRQGVIWSDGKPLTGQDVEFTINTVLDFQLPGNWAALVPANLIAKVQALDANTVKFFFKSKPGLAQWQYGLSGVPFVSKAFWEPLVAEAKKAATAEDRRKALYAVAAANEPVAGEMAFSRREKGAFVELKANPNYYFANAKITQYANGALRTTKPGAFDFTVSGDATGPVEFEYGLGPYVSSVIYNVYTSQDLAVLALQKGEIDFIASSSGLQQGFQQRLASDGNIRVLSNQPNNVRYLGFNLRKAPMDNKAFRQAVAILTDKEFVGGTLLQGAAQPAYAMVPPGNGAWFNSNVPALGRAESREQRIGEAVALLKGAGFTWDKEPKWNATTRNVDAGSGMKMPSGQAVPTLELLAPSPGFDPLRATFAIWAEQWLKEAGIPINLQLTGNNVITTRVFQQQNMDMWIGGFSLTTFPDYLRSFFYSTNAAPGGFNAGKYSSATFDAAADQLVQTTDLNDAKQQAFKLQAMLADDMPYVVLFTTQILEPARRNVTFPFSQVLSGFQAGLQSANGTLAYTKID